MFYFVAKETKTKRNAAVARMQQSAAGNNGRRLTCRKTAAIMRAVKPLLNDSLIVSPLFLLCKLGTHSRECVHFFVRSFRIRLSNTKTKITTENNVPKPSLFFVFVCFYQECSILCKTEARKLDAAAVLADNARRWAADSSRLTVSPLFLLCRLGTHLKKCVHFFA